MTATTTTGPAFVPDDRLAKRNAWVLAIAQALAGANGLAVVGTVSIAASSFGYKELATLPVTFFVIGLWVGTLPFGAIARHYGRRVTYLIGTGFGALAGLILMLATYKASLVLLCLGAASAGAYGAAYHSYRFAAADTASDAFKPKAISWVMAGGVMAGVFGPQLVILTKDIGAPYLFAASYLAQSAVAVIAAIVLCFLRIPVPPPAAAQVEQGRPLPEIFRQPRLIVAVVCGVVSYSMMNLVMTSAPLAMVDCGHSITDATLGLQWHVIAMYGPSFFTGSLILRFGVGKIMGIGLAVLAAGAVVGWSGLTVAHFWTALILLGLGWNFAFVGATTLVTACHRPNERNKVQAVNDFLVFGSMALGSFLSGKLLANYGWATVNEVVIPLVAVAGALLLWQALSRRLEAAA
jgi:predicted MFS family arabinose efflux permease